MSIDQIGRGPEGTMRSILRTSTRFKASAGLRRSLGPNTTQVSRCETSEAARLLVSAPGPSYGNFNASEIMLKISLAYVFKGTWNR